MTKKTLTILLACALIVANIAVFACNNSSQQESKTQESADLVAVNDQDSVDNSNSVEQEATQTEAIPKGASILIKCYPDFVKGYKDGKLIMSDGSSIVYDDGKKKSFEQKLDDADLEDMFAFKYDRKVAQPEYLQDAGRSRCEEFFKKMYGASASQVRSKLVSVDWIGEKVQFTKVNGADKKLKAVAEDMKKLPKYKEYLNKNYFKSEGTFYWRKVRGANRQSAHSYGMTIDIGGNYKSYWLWANPKATETSKCKYENKIPLDIVEVFEKHGFVWGGRWYHYDTMHFEYRPEILMDNP